MIMQKIYGLTKAASSFRLLYRSGEKNHCPGCGQAQWHVGRISAECAHCGTAIPLAHVAAQPMQPRFYSTESATILAA